MKKDKELVWVMTNCKRDFHLSNKDAHYADFDLIHKIIHAVPVDTTKHLSLYHNLIYKRLPSNLRPARYTAHKPSPVKASAANTLQNLNSARVLWKLNARTIYRPSSEWPHWLRNPSPINGAAFWLYQSKNLTHAERETLYKLQKKYGLTYLPEEDRFYEMFKISQKDLCHILDNAKDEEEVQKIIMERIYEPRDKTVHGRRGVLTLSQTFSYLRKLERAKEKVDEFVAKFGEAYGMTGRQVRSQGGVHVLDELG